MPFGHTNRRTNFMNQTFDLGSIVSSARVRAIIYSLFALIGVGLGATQVAFGFLIGEGVASGNPLWLGVALAVYPFLGAAGFAVSKANTPSPALAPAPKVRSTR